MSIKQAITDFFIEYEHTPDNVVHLNTPHARAHARANAAQSAMWVEENRKPTSDQVAQAFQDVLDAIEDQARATRRVTLAQDFYNRLAREANRE